MKIGLAQINTIVGDLQGNEARIIDAYQTLTAQGADYVVFPELVVTGYPPRDLLFKRSFAPDNVATAKRIAAQSGEVPIIFGFVEPNPKDFGRQFFNSAAVCFDGKIQHIGQKCLLPTYDVFDEDRYFEAATLPLVFEYKGNKVGITICEDIWTTPDVASRPRYRSSPIEYLKEQALDVHVNLSASPWHVEKTGTRRKLISDVSASLNCPSVYVNAVGGNDELIFDGRSMVADSQGNILTGLAGFAEECRVVDLETKAERSPSYDQSQMQDIEDALALGLRDYVHKSGFKKALIGLSGGIDSAVTAAIAVKALGKENVTGIGLPSAISSDHSKNDAEDLAEKLDIAFHMIPIEGVVEASETALAPLFKGLPLDVTEENIQARSRGLLLMALSNKTGALLLTTGNKSELSVGYCTLYGDMCGGLAVISDLPKVMVFDLARHMNRDSEIIPVNTIEKPPSAELRPDQKDEDSLPPYEILDAILKSYVEEGLSSKEIIAQGFDTDVVKDIIRKVDLNEYKRKQAAPGLKLTSLAFGVGRRIPIVQKYVS
ncbi:MAG: NAD+ synthase (glutamine-hydrolyzing) [Candidatus Pelagisphaera sp.]|jgi:NAD+ synthase (glutamine-hydrolysing)